MRLVFINTCVLMLCVGVLHAPNAYGQDGYETNSFSGEDDPRVVSSPIVLAPVYECSEVVGLEGVIPGATVELFVNGSSVFSSQVQEVEPAAIPVPPLVHGDVITAIQIFNGFSSAVSNEVEVGRVEDAWPDGMPEPRVNPPPLYECGKRTGSHEHLAGAKVRFFSQTSPGAGSYNSIAVGDAPSSETYFRTVSPAFSAGEAITTQYGFCGTISPMSGEEVVQPEPPFISPPIVGDVFEGMDRVLVNGIYNGARVSVSLNGASNVIGSQYSGALNATVALNAALNAGDSLQGFQELCSGSDMGDPVVVKPCADLPAPRIRTPEIGDDIVLVLESLPGAKVEIFSASGMKIGSGGGVRIRLIRTISPGETLYVRQVVGMCIGYNYWATESVCKKTDETPDPSADGQFEVGQLDYSLGDTMINSRLSRVSAHVRFPVAPGTDPRKISPWGGEFPIIFLLHGNHGIWRNPSKPPGDVYRDICSGNYDTPPTPGFPEVASHRGYDDLMDSLAHRGYIAVSIDGLDMNCRSGLIEERAELILRHIEVWMKVNQAGGMFGGGDMFRNRVDIQDIGLFGHSRGGEAVVMAAELVKSRFNPVTEARVSSVLSLAPTDIERIRSQDIPLVLLLPAVDGDVSTNEGARIYDRATRGHNPRWFRAQKYIYGANHNFFNAEWGFDDGTYEITGNTWLPRGPNRLSRPQQVQVLREFSRSLFDNTLYSEGHHRKELSGDGEIAALPRDIYTSYESASSFDVDLHEDSNAYLNDLGQAVGETGFSLFDEFTFGHSGSPYNSSFFQETNGLVARWDNPGASFYSLVGADVTNYRFFSFRITQVVAERNDLYGKVPTSIGIGLVGGSQSRVVSSDVGVIPYPYDFAIPHPAAISQSLPSQLQDKSMSHTLRVPTACLAEMGADPRVDLQNIEAVIFDTDQRARGVLGFDQISFTN